jgi:hypothetical protein
VILSAAYAAITVGMFVFAFSGGRALPVFVVPCVIVPWTAFGAWAGQDLWKPVAMGATGTTSPKTPSSVTLRLGGRQGHVLRATVAACGPAAVAVAYALGDDVVKGIIATTVIVTGLVLFLNWARKAD